MEQEGEGGRGGRRERREGREEVRRIHSEIQQ
jgi:hypothetical protein